MSGISIVVSSNALKATPLVVISDYSPFVMTSLLGAMADIEIRNREEDCQQPQAFVEPNV